MKMFRKDIRVQIVDYLNHIIKIRQEQNNFLENNHFERIIKVIEEGYFKDNCLACEYLYKKKPKCGCIPDYFCKKMPEHKMLPYDIKIENHICGFFDRRHISDILYEEEQPLK